MCCTLDDGPQVKKPSIEDPQAVAQAAIAKFVEKYVYMVVCVCCVCHMKRCMEETPPSPHPLQSWCTAGTATNDDGGDKDPQQDGGTG